MVAFIAGVGYFINVVIGFLAMWFAAYISMTFLLDHFFKSCIFYGVFLEYCWHRTKFKKYLAGK